LFRVGKLERVAGDQWFKSRDSINGRHRRLHADVCECDGNLGG
jgi:hypothetical protein